MRLLVSAAFGALALGCAAFAIMCWRYLYYAMTINDREGAMSLVYAAPVMTGCSIALVVLAIAFARDA